MHNDTAKLVKSLLCLSPRGLRMYYYKCKLSSLGISSTTLGSSDPGETVDPSYSYAVVPAVLFIFILLFIASSSVFFFFHSFSYNGARVFEKTLVHEFPTSYSRTEWYLLFSLCESNEKL